MNVQDALAVIANRPSDLPHPPNGILSGLQILSELQPERNADYNIAANEEHIYFHGFEATVALMSEEQVARMAECGWKKCDWESHADFWFVPYWPLTW